MATVSRVLNRSGYVDELTRRRVLGAVEALGYQRNIHWSRLASNSSRTILFVFGNREKLNSMQMRLLVACEKALGARGYDLVFTRFSYDAQQKPAKLSFPRLLQQPGAVDGVVLAGFHFENLLDALEARSMPYVLMGNNFVGSAHRLLENSLLYDDSAAALDAAEYLVRLGHRRIAFVGNIALPWFARRHQSFQEAARRHRFQPLFVTEDWAISAVDYGQVAVQELLRREEPPTAVFAANDEIAAGAWKELVRRKIPIPSEMSLIGFGEREEFAILEPPLTSVTVFEDNLGERLASMILARLETGRSVPSERYPCKLVERQSCAPWKQPVPFRRPVGLPRNSP